MAKFAYVIEDGDGVEKVVVDENQPIHKFIKQLCKEHFDGGNFHEVVEESGGLMFSLSEVQFVFVSEKDVDIQDVDQLWD